MDRVAAIICFLSALQVAALVLRLAHKKWQAVFLMSITAVIPFALFVRWPLEKDLINWGFIKIMFSPTIALVLAVSSLWRRLQVMFWVGWLLNLPFLVFLIYMRFFWRITGGF